MPSPRPADKELTVPRQPRELRATGRHPTAIRGLDPQLRQWLKARAVLEDCTIGELLNSIIPRYKDEVGWSQANATREHNPHPALTVRGLNPELWQWVKARAAFENRVSGDVINDMLNHYTSTAYSGESSLPAVVEPTSDVNYIVNIKGIDRALWQHLKDGAELEQKTIGVALNEIIVWYRRMVIWP